MFGRSADLYDALYSWKDYDDEVRRITRLVDELSPGAKTFLDVACGTGKHLELLRDRFQVEGVDLDPQLLAIAAGRNPGVPLHEGDMISFDLGRTFDVVVCLFSSIGYVETPQNLSTACASLSKHVAPGGILLLEPWLTPDGYEEGHIGFLTVDEPELKIARINTSRREGDVSVLDFSYLVGTPAGIEHFTEDHRLGLFTHEQYRKALTAAGLELQKDGDLMGRGLYVAVRPAASPSG